MSSTRSEGRDHNLLFSRSEIDQFHLRSDDKLTNVSILSSGFENGEADEEEELKATGGGCMTMDAYEVTPREVCFE